MVLREENQRRFCHSNASAFQSLLTGILKDAIVGFGMHVRDKKLQALRLRALFPLGGLSEKDKLSHYEARMLRSAHNTLQDDLCS
jgi:hypothetical protein